MGELTVTIALTHLTAGLSGALGLFAVMVLTSRVRALPGDVTWGATEQARRWNGKAWTLIALSAVIYRPMHGALLLNWPAQEAAALADLVAVAIACVAFIKLLAARGLVRGLSAHEVRLRVLINVTVMVAMTGATWLTR